MISTRILNINYKKPATFIIPGCLSYTDNTFIFVFELPDIRIRLCYDCVDTFLCQLWTVLPNHFNYMSQQNYFQEAFENEYINNTTVNIQVGFFAIEEYILGIHLIHLIGK